MKNFFISILILLSLIISLNNSIAQSGWFWQNPLPQGNNLSAVKFNDNYTGWAVGSKGTILKSTNGGLNWYIQNSTVQENLSDLFILSDQKVIVIGNYGVVLQTTNGGSAWTLNLITPNPVLKKIIFNDPLNGFICGYSFDYRKGYIYKTSDGGINWNLNFISPDGEYFDKLFFWDSNIGFTGGSWYTYKTTNAGINWIQEYNGGIFGTEIIYKNFSTGLVVGGGNYGTDYGYISKTTNNGINFHTVLYYTDTVISSITHSISDTVYSTGYYGKILKSTDYGSVWNSLNSNVKENLNSIYFSSNSTGYAVGNSGVIIKTSNEGLNWTNLRNGITHIFISGIFLDHNTGWISGPAGVIKTTNGGTNWITAWDSISYRDLYPLLNFTDNNNGWLVYTYYLPKLYKTTNTGANWELIHTFTANSGERHYPYSVFFEDNNTGFISGQKELFNGGGFYHNGEVFKTTNGGSNWEILSFGNKVMYDVKFVNSTTGYLAGDGGNLWKTTNTGVNWNFLNLNISFNYKIFFLNPDLGWILGKQGNISRLSKTSDGGLNWEYLILPDNIPIITSFQFLDENIGWLCGKGGLIYATTNGGQNWIIQMNPTNQDLYSINFVNYNTGWICGSNGAILKTISGIKPVGINSNNNLTIKNFSLSQNYPNPFNPKTIINYSIPSNVRSQTSDVKLLIYNSLGKHIATLVNEKQYPGSYSVEFNGEGLPSGIYFYKLEADNFVETKRMVLLK